MTLALAHLRRVVAGLLPLAVVVGCASSDQDAAARAQLERAQIAYRQAQADPNVQSYAQSRLSEAQKAMQAAEQAKDAGEMQHLGYVAEKKARIATTAGAIRKMEQDTQQMGKETSDILLQKRDRELKAARMEAEAKGLEAEQARMAAEARARDAEAKAREAEQARTEAEQARVQAEQARMQAEAEVKARSAEQAKTAALTKELSDLRAQQTDRGLVLIEGHCDERGTSNYNLALGDRRAKAAMNHLAARGIKSDRITIVSYGEERPVCTEHNETCWSKNRRAQFLIKER